jgi:predicted RNase H-like HicB family nuclease
VPRQFDVVIERDSEGYYVASVPQIPACHTQARSLDEVTERIREAIALCLEVEVPSCRTPAGEHRRMSRVPRVTGPELISSLAVSAFRRCGQPSFPNAA